MAVIVREITLHFNPIFAITEDGGDIKTTETTDYTEKVINL